MNRALLLGSLFLRVSTVYGAAAHGDLILEGRKRNEDAYERSLQRSEWKGEQFSQDKKENSSRISDKNIKATKPKSG